MSTLKKTLILGTTSALALSGMAAGVSVAAPLDDAPSDQAAAQEANSTYYKTDIVRPTVVSGTFAFTQTEVSPSPVISAIT